MTAQAVGALAMPTRNVEIEVLRALAVLMVLIEHVPLNLFFWHSSLQAFLESYWRGAVGVDLFFAISGYVIARSLLPRLAAASDTVPYLAEVFTFWVHRFWRLQPSAWLWVAIPLLLCVTFNQSGAFRHFNPNLASALAGVLAVSDLRFGQMMYGQDAGLMFPYWSLSLEEQFYLLLPLLAWLFRVRLSYAMGALVAWQFVMPDDNVFVVTRPGGVAMGVLLAIWSAQPGYAMAEPRFLARSRLARGLTLTGLLAVMGALASGLASPLHAVPLGLVAVLSGALVYAASFQRGYILQAGVLRSLFVWLGSRSYAVYLTHIPAFALARELYVRFGPPMWSVTNGLAVVHLLLGFGLTLLFSELNYRFVEMPWRRYGRSVRIGP